MKSLLGMIMEENGRYGGCRGGGLEVFVVVGCGWWDGVEVISSKEYDKKSYIYVF